MEQARHPAQPHAGTDQSHEARQHQVDPGEPYFDLKTPNSIAEKVGGQVAVLMPLDRGVKEVTTYFQLFDYDINLLVNLFNKTK